MNRFNEITIVDFEYTARDGERPEVICGVAHELRSGRVHRLSLEDLLSQPVPPYPIGPDCLLVAFYAPAEVGCHLTLGWPVPENILDLFVEARNFTNGRYLPHGSSLLGMATYFGLPAIDAVEKKEMRDLAIRGGPFTAAEMHDLLRYCESDVELTERLFNVMLPKIDLDRALLRGRSMAALARIEHAGIPIDTRRLDTLRNRWDGVKGRLVEAVDVDYGLFDGTTFKVDRFEGYLAKGEIDWPRLPTGRLALDDDTFRERSRAHPVISPIADLRQALSQMRLNALAVGRDGRNRCMLSPFRAITGRNQPSNSRFIFGPSAWLRSLILPHPGHALAYLDYEQQEFGIAASLSNDAAMMRAYQSEDPYLAFAKQAKAAPPEATKESHEAVREQFKQCALGVLYNMGPMTLAERTGLEFPYAQDLLRLHRATYPQFWRWSDRVVNHALLFNRLQTVFGWQLWVTGEPNPNSLRNFPMQANGAEMLRLACCLAIERGVKIVAPIHDALLIEARPSQMQAAIATAQNAMAEASRIVLSNLTLRTEVKSFQFPLRYRDKRGRRMWNLVWQIIRDLEAGK